MFLALCHTREQFAPFLLPEDELADPEAYYEQYCDTLETTAGTGLYLGVKQACRAWVWAQHTHVGLQLWGWSGVGLQWGVGVGVEM
jgi:hypothetical protein